MKIFNIPINNFGVPFDKWWKRVIMHFLIGLVVSAIVCYFAYPDYSLYFRLAFLYFLSDIFQAFTHMLIYMKLDERYDWMEDTRKRIFYSISLHTIGTFANYFTVPLFYLHFVFHLTFVEAFYGLLGFWFIPIGIVAFVMVFAVAGDFFKNWKKSLAFEEKLKAELMNYKYESLRNQINPHFLLESFQFLKKLVKTNSEQASEFILNISNLYRHVLEVKDQEFITISEELKFIQPYIELLKLRFGDRLKITFEVEANQEDIIPPLCLQFLIENAIETNIVSDHQKLEIHISMKDEHIEVKNTKNSDKKLLEILNSKMQHLTQQYQQYSSKPIEFIEQDDSILTKLPILKQV